MPHPGRDVFASNASALSRLMKHEPSAPLWTDDELGSILQHQLASPLELEFNRDGEPRPPADAFAAQWTFGQLLFHASPPGQLLKKTKEFGKRYMYDASSPLPREIATVIYFASIVAAMCKLGQRISSLGDDELRNAIEWVLTRPWLDERLRKLFESGIRGVGDKR